MLTVPSRSTGPATAVLDIGQQMVSIPSTSTGPATAALDKGYQIRKFSLPGREYFQSRSTSPYDFKTPVEKKELMRSHIFRESCSEGADIPMLHPEDQQQASLLVEALKIRKKYLNKSMQKFNPVTYRFLESTNQLTRETTTGSAQSDVSEDVTAPPGIKNPWRCKVPRNASYRIVSQDGCINAYHSKKKLTPPPVSIQEFVADMTYVNLMMCDGPLKSFCLKRLQQLSLNFDLHILKKSEKETQEQKNIKHRDFYNVTKVDTHVHAASCFTQKHLMNFIKKKMETEGEEVVMFNDDQPVTLNQLFGSYGISADTLNLDILDMHAGTETFGRFDVFNQKFNPMGQNIIREIFLKTENHIGGRYFAELLQEVMKEVKDSRHEKAEIRLSIYGSKPEEWSKLADWAVDNNIYSDDIRWIIQIPRLYDVYRKKNFITTFDEWIKNIFQPLFEATNKPANHLNLHTFLKYVVAFDSVDDETKSDEMLDTTIVPPENWGNMKNPSYMYYLFYMYANICSLNEFRSKRGFNTFAFRPHCGEAGPMEHLIGGFLLCESISHGISLTKAPVMQYLYYLAQTGIAMSPISNNCLFLEYEKNPFETFFKRGLTVCLSTDDPLQFHFTKEPLLEEYGIASHIWKFTSTDICEIARNSVLISSFPKEWKIHWLGKEYEKEGTSGNNKNRTNVPNVRIEFRHKMLSEELNALVSSAEHCTN